MSQLTEEEKLECLKEAVASHGNTDRTRKWYKKWKPKYYAEYGIPTTVQYSLSCSLMKDAFELCYGDPENLRRNPIRDYNIEETNFVGIERVRDDKFVEECTYFDFENSDLREYERKGFYPFKLSPSDLGENDFGTEDADDCFNNFTLLDDGNVYTLLNFEERLVNGPIYLEGVSENDAKEFKKIVENQGAEVEFRGRFGYPYSMGGNGEAFLLEIK